MDNVQLLVDVTVTMVMLVSVVSIFAIHFMTAVVMVFVISLENVFVTHAMEGTTVDIYVLEVVHVRKICVNVITATLVNIVRVNVVGMEDA